MKRYVNKYIHVFIVLPLLFEVTNNRRYITPLLGCKFVLEKHVKFVA